MTLLMLMNQDLNCGIDTLANAGDKIIQNLIHAFKKSIEGTILYCFIQLPVISYLKSFYF